MANAKLVYSEETSERPKNQDFSLDVKQKIREFELLVDEMTSKVPRQEWIAVQMAKLNIPYDADPVVQLRLVLLELQKLHRKPELRWLDSEST